MLGKTPLEKVGFSKAQQRAPGILIPLHGVDGSIVGYQYRPDHPRLNEKGKPIKYENPAGSSVRLDVPPRCRELLANPQIPAFFVEGAKKADAVHSENACVINVSGVWNFKGKNAFGGTTILADFDYVPLKHREIYVAYDSDYKDKPQVRQAAARLSEHLTRKGAKVKTIYLPSGPQGEKLGVGMEATKTKLKEDRNLLGAIVKKTLAASKEAPVVAAEPAKEE